LKKFFAHNDALSQFNELIYKDVLVKENIISRKKAIVIDKEKYYGYFLSKKMESFFLQDSAIDKLPLKVTQKKEVDYKGDVFNFVQGVESVKIPNVKSISFKDVVNLLGSFPHTNELHWTLYKILSVASFCDRINYRVITPLGFGKDCIVNNLIALVGDTVNLYGATFAKLEYSLKYKNLIFNEMGNLKPEDKSNMQQFLLASGAYFNEYTKRSRKTEDTQEQYDISRTSIGILYNPPEYYIERGQEYFDVMFTKAVISRFIPFFFEGLIQVPQLTVSPKDVAESNMEDYKNVVSTLNYYKENYLNLENKYELPIEIGFNKGEERFERTFLTIAKYVAEYSEDEEEYKELIVSLFNCFRNYLNKIDNLRGEIKK